MSKEKMKYHEYNFLVRKEDEEEIIDYMMLINYNDYFIEREVKNDNAVMKFYMSYKNPDENILKELMGIFNLEILSHEVVEEMDWLKAWMDTLQPFEFIEGIWVNPFPDKPLKDKKTVIDIIPGTAFGTGLHPTTRLAGELLAVSDLSHKTVLDVGCGTAILSMISKIFGAEKVLGIDYDILAVEKAEETVELNNQNIEIRHSDFLSALKNDEKFDIIVSNMVAEILVNLMSDEKFDTIMKEGTVVIFSGIMDGKEELVINNASKHGLKEIKRMEDGSWRGLIFRKI
ncbi:MAG: 50S ribosomal protein L11 methyltransferase [Thermotogae bacterium]|nr:50S ribosomal protein L11 methyltransferase [Thermotogota bacterium]